MFTIIILAYLGYGIIRGYNHVFVKNRHGNIGPIATFFVYVFLWPLAIIMEQK